LARSLASVIAAVIVGLMTARLVEQVARAFASAPPASAEADTAYGVLVVSWGIAAFVAALVALIAGKRWAPLGWLAASTMGLNALVTLVGAAPPLWAWPAGLLSAALGGVAAIRLIGAKMRHPDRDSSAGGGLFS